MARRKRRQARERDAFEQLEANEAAVLLEKLRELGHVTAAHLRDARNAVSREAENIADRLSWLKGSVQIPKVGRKPPKRAAASPQVRPGAKGAGRKTKGRVPVSAERRKVMELQGRYMALGHQIPKLQMQKFRKMIETKGKEATLKAMQAYVESHAKKPAKNT